MPITTIGRHLLEITTGAGRMYRKGSTMSVVDICTEEINADNNKIEHFHHPMGDFKEFADVSASGHGFQG